MLESYLNFCTNITMDGKDDFEEWRKALEEAVEAAQEKEKSEGIKKMGMEKWL